MSLSIFLLILTAGLAVVDSVKALPLVPSTNYDSAQLEKIMFVNKLDAAAYRNNCGSDWYRLFAEWESIQRAAIQRQVGVKSIVWRCRRFCGGLGDRQRGILTSFTLALVTKRAFFIDNEYPVPLQHFFHVANPELHWTFDETLLEGRRHIEEDFTNALPLVGDFASANLSYYEEYDVVIQSNNFWKPLSILQNPSLRSVRLFNSFKDHILAGCFLNYLLVPARELQMQVYDRKAEAAQANKFILALQVRTGDSQAKQDTMLDDVVRYFQDCVGKIQASSRAGFRLFLTTDSLQVANRLKYAHPDMFVFEGQIVHIDGDFGSGESPSDAFRKVVLDHVMISQAQTLVISRSGFGEYAAMRGFKSYYTPLHCDYKSPVPHYEFPSSEPQGVPATDNLTAADIFFGFHVP